MSQILFPLSLVWTKEKEDKEKEEMTKTKEIELGPVTKALKAEERCEQLEEVLYDCWGEATLLLQGERRIDEACFEIIKMARDILRPHEEKEA